MSVRRNSPPQTDLPNEAVAVARQALAESRLRGLPAAEEYRVIADRLYRSGFRDLPSGALVTWIEQTVADEYERFLELRRLGESLHGALAAGDLAQAAWALVCELDTPARERIANGIRRLNQTDQPAPPTR